MNDRSIYVIVDKLGDNPTKSTGWKDARKLLVYTTPARARAAMKSRGLNPADHDVVEYIPKEDKY